jgi:hypothetical protein
MNYYRLSFNKITVPDPLGAPLHRQWDWYDFVCVAQNRDEAKDHGRKIALDNGVTFVDAIRLPRVVGAVQINREPAFRKVP